MGRNVKKCTINLYNIPQGTPIPTLHSTAWSFDSQGPTKGNIEAVTMFRDSNRNSVCYEVEKSIPRSMPQNIKNILADHKYMGVMTNAQLDLSEGKTKLINKLSHRISVVSRNTNSIREARILHNMIVCQVATFSPMCISMMLKECTMIDKQLLNVYKYRMNHMPMDAKHGFFISEKKGGIGIKYFT
jgi:hypothetical protein